MPRVIIQKSGGGWWKALLGFFLGVIFGVVGVVIGVAGAAAYVRTGDVITMVGGDPDAILTPAWQDKTALDIVMDAVGGNIKIETLGDIADITPMIDTYIGNLSDQLSDLGCELTKEEIYQWPLTELSDNLITSVKKVELINFLSKDKTDNPDPVVKYLCYKTDEHGEYILDADGKLIPQTLSDMLDNGSFLQSKIDNMKIGVLFTEQQINDSKMLSAIKDKTVTDLSKDGAFDDVKISDVMVVKEDSSKIVKALDRDGVTIGKIGDGVNNLLLDDVFEYSNYDTLPAVLKKLLAKEAYTIIPGEEITSTPFSVHKMIIDTVSKTAVEYDYIVLSDGTLKEGVDPSKAVVTDLVNKTDYIKLGDIVKDSLGNKVDRGFETVTVNKVVDSEDNVTWEAETSDPIDRDLNLETIDININSPVDWAKTYVYICNKPAKVEDLDSSIDSLKLKDVMKIKTDDALWKVRNEDIKNGEELFNSIKENLTVKDIITNKDDVKFLNKIDDNTTIDQIGNAVNNLRLLDAFDDNIYDSDGKLNIKWKYLLVDSTEWKDFNTRFAPGTVINRDDDPFKTHEYEIEMAKPEADRDPTQYMKCNEYTVGGSGDKGVDQLITNMTNNMKVATIKELNGDGMVNVAPGFISMPIPTYYTRQAYYAGLGKVEYGDLTLEEFTDLISGGVTVVTP